MNQEPKPAYRLTHVTDSNSYDTTRGAHRTKQVHYVLADGTRSYIEHPLDMHNAEHIQQTMDDIVQKHDEIMSLQGQPTVPGQVAPPNPWGGSG